MREKKKPLTVLYVDTGIGLAGGQTALVEILRFVDRTRIAPIVSSPPGSALEAVCGRLGIPWLGLPFASVHISTRPRGRVMGRLRDLASSAYGAAWLARQVRRCQADVLAANTFKAALVGAVALMFSKRPLVFHDRTLFGHLPLGWLLGMKARRIVAVSRAAAAKYRGMFAGKLAIVPDSVDTDRFRAAPAEPRSVRIVAYLGRISEEKGIIHLVRCVPRVLKRAPGVRFLIGGTPFTPRGEAYLNLLTAEIAGLGLADAIEFVGQVDDARAFLGEIDALVLPSEKEGLGRVMLEAMALGKPVIAFASGGPAEVISNGEDGLLVPLGDDAGLADAVVSILCDSALAARIGLAARQTVVRHYSSKMLTARLVEVYSDVCPRHGGE